MTRSGGNGGESKRDGAKPDSFRPHFLKQFAGPTHLRISDELWDDLRLLGSDPKETDLAVVEAWNITVQMLEREGYLALRELLVRLKDRAEELAQKLDRVNFPDSQFFEIIYELQNANRLRGNEPLVYVTLLATDPLDLPFLKSFTWFPTPLSPYGFGYSVHVVDRPSLPPNFNYGSVGDGSSFMGLSYLGGWLQHRIAEAERRHPDARKLLSRPDFDRLDELAGDLRHAEFSAYVAGEISDEELNDTTQRIQTEAAVMRKRISALKQPDIRGYTYQGLPPWHYDNVVFQLRTEIAERVCYAYELVGHVEYHAATVKHATTLNALLWARGMQKNVPRQLVGLSEILSREKGSLSSALKKLLREVRSIDSGVELPLQTAKQVYTALEKYDFGVKEMKDQGPDYVRKKLSEAKDLR